MTKIQNSVQTVKDAQKLLEGGMQRLESVDPDLLGRLSFYFSRSRTAVTVELIVASLVLMISLGVLAFSIWHRRSGRSRGA